MMMLNPRHNRPVVAAIGAVLAICQLASALEMRSDRRTILSDSGNFPTDLYMAQGLIDTLGKRHQLRVVAPEAVAESIDNDIAAVLLTEVDYRSGRKHDMLAVTERAHRRSAAGR